MSENRLTNNSTEQSIKQKTEQVLGGKIMTKKETQYYGYRCYDNTNKPPALGWLYTYNNDRDMAYTNCNLDWCKRWKTERGAKKNFDWYNRIESGTSDNIKQKLIQRIKGSKNEPTNRPIDK